MRVGLVACAKTKLAHPAPARELYASQLFRLASAYCADHYDAWYVLSAAHGLVHPETVLAPYDLTLATFGWVGRHDWAVGVREHLLRLHPAHETAFYAHAGRLYCAPLQAAGLVVVPCLEGLQIGHRLRWYTRTAAIAAGLPGA